MYNIRIFETIMNILIKRWYNKLCDLTYSILIIAKRNIRIPNVSFKAYNCQFIQFTNTNNNIIDLNVLNQNK